MSSSTTHSQSACTHELVVHLNGAQLEWLEKQAAGQEPTLDASAMLTRLVEHAVAASEVDHDKRAHQLEVYRVSGYPEHHPDYPNVPRGTSND
jgi:hypothetical protein